MNFNEHLNLPKLKSTYDQALDVLVTILNHAKITFEDHQTLFELAHTRGVLDKVIKVPLCDLTNPLIPNSEKIIKDAIENKWLLTNTFHYTLTYMGRAVHDCVIFNCFEAVFSQPTVEYPIPQATVTVFFKVEERHTESIENNNVPRMIFKVEGTKVENDIRQVCLTVDSILAVLKMKVCLFKKIEDINLF